MRTALTGLMAAGMLALPGVADRYAASHHPVLALYGKLANLTGLR